jgi:membrane-bound serine protease (ClpP class)
MNFLLDPNVAYLVLLTGSLLGLLALITPGTGAFELGALFCLLVAGYAITQLAFNLWALLLVMVSVVPFMYAIQKPKREWALALSLFFLVLGSAYLFHGDHWWIPSVNPFLAVIASIVYVGYLWIAVTKSIQAFHSPLSHDLAALIGQVGVAKTRIHDKGSVQVAGELWSAHSKEVIETGKKIKVVARNGFLLEVEAESERK